VRFAAMETPDSKWRIISLCCAIVIGVLLAYRASVTRAVRPLRTNVIPVESQVESVFRNTVQCRLKVSSAKNRVDTSPPSGAGVILRSNDSGLFPFPKHFHSSEAADHTFLRLSDEFRIHSPTQSYQDVNLLTERFCLETVAPTRSTGSQVIAVQNIEVYFSDANILASSEAMRTVLDRRPSDVQENARYIDAEMYALNVTAEGRVQITVHSPALYEGASRGLANALATLEQLVSQAVPVQLPLAIVDWPDNHWRGE
jgi:hypothetical protein